MLPEKLVADIIKEQSLIIGEKLARSRAEVTGTVAFASAQSGDLSITTDTTTAIEKLINSYNEVFGQASVEVCLSVIRRYPKAEVLGYLPDNLKTRL